MPLLTYRNLHDRYRFLPILVLFFFSEAIFSQEHLTDSLEQRRAYYKSQPNFTEKDTNYIKTLYELARSYAYQNYDSIVSIADQATSLSKNIGFKKGEAGAKLAIATGKALNGEFETGLTLAQEAEQIAWKFKSDSIALKAMNVRGMIQLQKGDFAEGYIICRQGIIEAERAVNKQMLLMFTMNLATSFALLKDHERALPYYSSCLDLLKDSGDSLGLAQVKSNLSYLYIQSKDYKKASDHGSEALDYLKRKKVNAWAGFAANNLGQAYLKQNMADKAIILFKEAENLLINIQDRQRTAEKDLGLAEAYFMKNQFDLSESYANMAEETSKSINYYEGIIKTSNLLYQLNKQKGNTEKAIGYLEKATRLADSIRLVSNKTKLLMLEAQTNFEQEQLQIKEENEKKLLRQKAITYISIALLLLFGAIIILIRRNIALQKKANKKLQAISATKDEIFAIIGHDLKAPISTLQELLSLYENEQISTEEFLKLAPKLRSNVDHSAFTLNNLLYWAQQQMKGTSPIREQVYIKATIDSIIKLYKTQIEKKEITVSCKLPKELTFQIDAEHFNIILRNIISNAIKYTNRKGNIKFVYENTNHHKVIKICDDGVGMTSSLVDSILAGKYRSSPGTNKEKGTGLGLLICQNLLKVNNSALQIESKLGSGSCITIVLA